jgi:signal transduction histidine kinase/DNA-binding response OmpR family regulator
MRYAKNFHHNPSDGNSINNNRPVAIHRDGQGIIWIGTEGGGLNRLDPSDETFKYWRYDPRDSTSIAGDIVYVLADDGKGHLWVGTDNGVCRFDKNSRTFRRYFRGSGELSNLVLAIVVDGGGKIWIGYRDNGLSQLDPETGEFRNFTRKDGLPADRFSFNSQSYRRRNGEIVMGTQNGILVFTPEGILENTHVPGIALRSFNIFGKEIPIQKAVERSEQVVLSYDENFFTFAFAALDLTDPSRNQLACKLDGLEDRWTFLGTRREARYTNLSPGEYVFRVKGSNNDGVWNEQGTSLKIVILPPWWRTAWAYLGYGIAFGGMLYTIRRSEKNRERLRHRAELAHTRAKTLEELDAMKSRFFANISHEFRTPLTLIAGPARQILAGEPNFDAKENAGIIVRNSQRLLTLVNQLLDLSKLESGNLILHAGEIDIADVAKGMVASFESMAATKRIHLSLALAQESIVGWFDRDAIEKILANLLSNAFKFTGNGGRVNVKIQIVPDGRSGGDAPVSSHVEIVVSDTGIGIGEEHLDKIFDRFYQVDVSPARGHEGTGIGLALTKEFVELHQGQISVASEVGGGTSFTVLLPLGAEHRSPGTIAPASVPSGASMAQSSIGDAEIGPRSADNEPDPDSRAPLLLIVEDNTDMRKYIRNYIDGRYRVVEAQDGAEGVEKAVELIPDLIISDVMMPNIEGFELCRRLKTDERTSHIPIILLTAKAGSENKLEGLSTGADDYLVKPFDAKELQMRVKNLIEGRRRLREKFEQSMTLKPGELKVSSMDDAFLQRAMTVVEQHMGDEHFSVDKFSEDMNMSRVQLHRKLKALTNLAASDFVRTMRLQRAMNLLQQDAATIAEISFMVGFGSPAYFTKCFREQFGCPPSEVIKRTPPRMPGHPPGTD